MGAGCTGCRCAAKFHQRVAGGTDGNDRRLPDIRRGADTAGHHHAAAHGKHGGGIQTIRDLCSAQQELGVVEDDIAASGAQQRLFYYVLLTCSFAWTARGQPKSVRITPCRAASRKTKLREALGFRPDWATTPGKQFTRSLRLPQPFGCLGLLKGYSTPRGRSSDNISSRAGCKGPLVATI